MLILHFTLRHLRRHWRLNLAVLLGLTLAGALLASLPSYATAIAARGLNQSIRDAPPASRNIQVTTAGDLSAGLYGRIEDSLGDLIQGRLEVRETMLPAATLPFSSTVLLGKRPIQASICGPLTSERRTSASWTAGYPKHRTRKNLRRAFSPLHWRSRSGWTQPREATGASVIAWPHPTRCSALTL